MQHLTKMMYTKMKNKMAKICSNVPINFSRIYTTFDGFDRITIKKDICPISPTSCYIILKFEKSLYYFEILFN